MIPTLIMGLAVTPNTPRITRLFRNTNSRQAVYLPPEFELNAEEVYIRREGHNLIITPKIPRSWAAYFDNAQKLSEDFPDFIHDLPQQQREAF